MTLLTQTIESVSQPTTSLHTINSFFDRMKEYEIKELTTQLYQIFAILEAQRNLSFT